MPRSMSLAIRRPPRNKYFRVLGCIIGQKSRTQICPDFEFPMDTYALVTGGTDGIGLEIANGLRGRGASVISASRGSNGEKQSKTFVRLDLADLASIEIAVNNLAEHLDGKSLSILCLNAGISARSHSKSTNGYEKTFAVNCLGHQFLFRRLHEKGLIAENAAIVITTGDIYCLADDCTSDFEYEGRGISAYCRSKLGNIWQAKALAKRFPQYRVVAVHPGVVASNLEGPLTGIKGVIARAIMMSPEQGAQASLIAATQPKVRSGEYFHNMRGITELRPQDPGNLGEKADRFMSELDNLINIYLSNS